MNKDMAAISCDQVLESFAMEPSVDGATLTRYLKKYPEFAEELVSLSNEIFLVNNTEERELTAEDEKVIDAAWSRIQSAGSSAIGDPLAELSPKEARNIARSLNVPMQVILAFCERTVEVASIPGKFLDRFARLLSINAKKLEELLTFPPQLARSYKADEKPANATKVTFEQLLRDASLSDQDIKSLMEDRR
jgi:hypothetical protein